MSPLVTTAMSCDNPIFAIQEVKGAPLKVIGRYADYPSLYQRTPVFDRFLLPCGKCMSCLMSRAKDWTLRCKDELSLHDASCFITLTYDDEHLPPNQDLCRRDYQLFLKRLRKRLAPLQIRYFGCGEYGAENMRPHYHIILFGWCPDDFDPWCNTGRSIVYRSTVLESFWRDDEYRPIGYCTVGTVTDESIAYVCRYSLKKLELDYSSRSVLPFTFCSTRPAIGLRWLEKNFSDLLVKDANGAILRYGHFDVSHFVLPPRYYTKRATNEGDLAGLSRYLRSRALERDVSVDDVRRRLDYSAYRQRLHNTHYGLDVLAQFQKTQTHEEQEVR